MFIRLLFNIQDFTNSASFEVASVLSLCLMHVNIAKSIAENQVLLLCFLPSVVQLFLVLSIYHHDYEGKGTTSVARLFILPVTSESVFPFFNLRHHTGLCLASLF